MKRIFAMLIACLFMVAVIVVMTAPAFASCRGESQNCGNQTGNGGGNNFVGQDKCKGNPDDRPASCFN